MKYIPVAISVYQLAYTCGACGSESLGRPDEFHRNCHGFDYHTAVELPADVLIEVQGAPPDGWERIDPFGQSRMIDSNLFCELCAPGIRYVMKRARAKAIVAFANQTKS